MATASDVGFLNDFMPRVAQVICLAVTAIQTGREKVGFESLENAAKDLDKIAAKEANEFVVTLDYRNEESHWGTTKVVEASSPLEAIEKARKSMRATVHKQGVRIKEADGSGGTIVHWFMHQERAWITEEALTLEEWVQQNRLKEKK